LTTTKVSVTTMLLSRHICLR